MKKLLLFIGIISWTYNLNAQCYDNLPVMETFDVDKIGVCWQVDDVDGDGYDWYWREYLAVYGGYKCLVSRSYNTADGALTPDNWVISLPIDLTSFSTGDNIQLSWKVRGEYANFSHEYYSVYVATNNQLPSFTNSTVVTSEYADEAGGKGTFVPRSMDISSLAGNFVYVAFRHYNSTNQYSINIDDVSISTAALGLGIEDFNKENFKFYYSPNSQTLSIRSANNPISAVEIFNILGQNVVSKSSTSYNEDINLSSLTDGVYIAQVEIDNTVKAIKFLKQ